MAQSQCPTRAQAVANIYETPELREKITLHVPVPAASIGSARTSRRRASTSSRSRTSSSNQGNSGGLLGLYDLFVGGQLSRATVFALGIMPYISASIFVQIAGAVIPTVEKMQKDEEGRKKLTQWTRYATVVLALVQA